MLRKYGCITHCCLPLLLALLPVRSVRPLAGRELRRSRLRVENCGDFVPVGETSATSFRSVLVHSLRLAGRHSRLVVRLVCPARSAQLYGGKMADMTRITGAIPRFVRSRPGLLPSSCSTRPRTMLSLHGHRENSAETRHCRAAMAKAASGQSKGIIATPIRLWPQLLLSRQRALLAFTQRVLERPR